MNDFVAECRREWRRLGVPDPIANEMSADLSADIEEAEAEGGSAEDVLGSSVFDPRRFAAAWAGARGLIPPAPDRPSRRRPVVALALTGLTALIALAAAVLLVGHRSSAVAAPVRRILAGPGSFHIVPGLTSPPSRFFPNGQPFAVHNVQGFEVLTLILFLLFLIGVVGFTFAVLYWSPWSWRRLPSSVRSKWRSTGPDGSNP